MYSFINKYIVDIENDSIIIIRYISLINYNCSYFLEHKIWLV